MSRAPPLAPSRPPPCRPPRRRRRVARGAGVGGPHIIPGLWVGPARQQQPHALLVAFAGRLMQGRPVALERRGAHDTGERASAPSRPLAPRAPPPASPRVGGGPLPRRAQPRPTPHPPTRRAPASQPSPSLGARAEQRARSGARALPQPQHPAPPQHRRTQRPIPRAGGAHIVLLVHPLRVLLEEPLGRGGVAISARPVQVRVHHLAGRRPLPPPPCAARLGAARGA